MAFVPILLTKRRQKRRKYLKRIDPTEFYDDAEFFERFRFRKDTFKFVCDLVESNLRKWNRNLRAITVKLKVAAALPFYAPGKFLLDVGDGLGGIHKATISRIATEVSKLFGQ